MENTEKGTASAMTAGSEAVQKPDKAPNAPKIGSGGYFVFLVIYLALLSAFGSFVNDMYLPTLPEMKRAFNCSVSTVQLGLTFGMIGLGLGELILGPLSDRYGRKPILLGSLVVFCIGAAASVYSPTIHAFLWWRLVQGLGASGGYFLARTIPADLYGGRQLAKVMALVGAINGFAPASAPVVGGLVAKSIGWRGIFWILFGFSALLLILSPALKESLPPSRRDKGRFGTAFLNYKSLVKNRRFVTHVMLKGSALGVLFAYISSAPFIIQTHYGYSQLQFGLWMGMNALFVAAGATMALKFKPLKKAAVWGARILMLISTAQVICFFLCDHFWLYEGLNIPMLVCLGMLFTVGNTLSMNEGRKCAGDASALIGIVGYIFGALVSPLVGMGNILHSTGLAFVCLSVLVLIFARMSKKLPADLNAQPDAD